MTKCFKDPERLQKYLDRRLTWMNNNIDDEKLNLNETDIIDMKSSEDSFDEGKHIPIDEKFDLTIDITKENDFLEREDIAF